MSLPVIAVFDIGKTNKKLFLVGEDYAILHERSETFKETVDEEGFPCDDIGLIQKFIRESLREVQAMSDFDIRAVNCAAYGASFAYLDNQGKTIGPLYNYLKPYPEGLRQQFYAHYGGETGFSFTTASPVLGSLNSGMQLYRLKYEKPEFFNCVAAALHLPQYICFLVSGARCSEMTSLGCHTNMWDFSKREYHAWLAAEKVLEKLPPIVPAARATITTVNNRNLAVGPGIHDSSAALVPYLTTFPEPFVLISSGTWCISLNPFNESALTAEELAHDCLCYLQHEGKPVKASRLFAGKIHEEGIERIANHFSVDVRYFNSVAFNPKIAQDLRHKTDGIETSEAFAMRDLSVFANADEAYHALMAGLVAAQRKATMRIVSSNTKKIFVDGGFSKNSLYLNLLALHFPQYEVFAASIPQATALGAALVVHPAWNQKPVPRHLVTSRKFPPGQ